MIVPWRRQQRDQMAHRQRLYGWLIGSTLSVGLVTAAALWLAREARSRQTEPEADGFDFRFQKSETAFPARAMDTGQTLPEEASSTSQKSSGKRSSHRKSSRFGESGIAGHPEDHNKMVTGGEDLRFHDFPSPVSSHRTAEEAVAVDTGAPPPEAIQAGGEVGKVPGDRQMRGEETSILDEVEATPEFAQEL